MTWMRQYLPNDVSAAAAASESLNFMAKTS